MRLILIRHARAEEHDERAWPDDRLRPLVSRGRKEQALMAGALARLNLGITDLLSSPWARAKETAVITAEALGLAQNRIVDCDELGDRCSVRTLVARLARLPAGATVAAVGHEPHLSQFAAEMLHPSGDLAIDFKKSAVLCLDFEKNPAPGAGTLRFFLTPKTLLSILD